MFMSDDRRSRLSPAGPRAVPAAILLTFLLILPGALGAPTPHPRSADLAPTAAPSELRTSPPSACAAGAPAPCPVTAAPTPQVVAENWFNVSSSQRTAPPVLRGASLAYDAIDNYVVLFGGCSSTACPASSQTWEYAGGSWTNLTGSSAQPPARSGASLVFDSHDYYVLLFGGRGAGGQLLNDTWSFVGGLWTNLTNVTSAPPARWAASMEFDHPTNYVTLFGGQRPNGVPLNDTWRYFAGLWRNLTGTTGPTPAARFGAAFVDDVGDAFGLLFGGSGASGLLSDTWSFVRGRWAPLNFSTLPPARAFAAMSFYAQDNATYLFGGNTSSGPRADTWKFAFAHWANVSANVGTVPSSRVAFATMESTEGWTLTGVKKWPYVLAFGGSRSACLTCLGVPTMNDSFVLEPVLSVAPTALPTSVETGQPVTFGEIAAGGSSPYVFQWQFGDGTSAFGSAPVHPYPAPSIFDASVNVTDTAGAWARGIVSVTVVPGPAVLAVAVPSVTDVGYPISFSSSASGGSPPFAYSWNFGDLTNGVGAAIAHSYGIAGNFSVGLTVSDAVQGFGLSSAHVMIHALPTISAIASNNTPMVGTNVSFSSAISGGTAPYVILWNFGDNASAAGDAPTHRYDRPGTYTVSAAVHDSPGAMSWRNLSLVVQPSVVPPAPHDGSTGPSTELWLGYGLVAAAIVLAAVAALLLAARRKRPPPASLAAAPVERDEWTGDSNDDPSHSRSARRNMQRFYRRHS